MVAMVMWALRIACLLTVGFSASMALAHAMLAKAAPAVGSTIRDTPTQVVLEFTEQIEPVFSTIQVEDGNGNQVSEGAAALAGRRRDALAVKLADIGPGTYKVTWKAVSVDTHVTRGSFSFTVLPRLSQLPATEHPRPQLPN
jgi:copper resistance protein C